MKCVGSLYTQGYMTYMYVYICGFGSECVWVYILNKRLIRMGITQVQRVLFKLAYSFIISFQGIHAVAWGAQGGVMVGE